MQVQAVAGALVVKLHIVLPIRLPVGKVDVDASLGEGSVKAEGALLLVHPVIVRGHPGSLCTHRPAHCLQ